MASFDEVLKDCTKLGTKIPTNEYLKNGKYPVIDQGQSDIAGYHDSDSGLFENVPAIVFGDHTRAVKYVDKPCFLGADGVKLLCPLDKDINCKYLFYQLSCADIPNTGYNRHFKWVKALNFKIPSSDEQNHVVEVLDKVTSLIFLRKQQLAKLDELVKARFVEMFGEPVSNPYKFEVRSLQNMLDDGIITYHLDGNHGSDYPRNEEFVQTGIPYISANCIVNGNIDFSLAKHLTKERAKKLRKGIAQNGDVLFAHNATVGPVSILYTDEEKVILGTSLTAYRCNKKVVLPPYLKCYMQSDGFVRQYSKDMKQTTRNQVPITIQRKYLFMIPPLSLQNEFAAFVERVDQQKQTVQQSLEKLELMKKALMQEYFG